MWQHCDTKHISPDAVFLPSLLDYSSLLRTPYSLTFFKSQLVLYFDGVMAATVP